jgi:hypothetical protein
MGGGISISRGLACGEMLDFLAKHRRCVAAPEASGGTHRSSRETQA